MNKKTKRLGVDIGNRSLHIVEISAGGNVTRSVNTPVPEGLVREGQIVSYQAMSEFLKDVRKSEGLRVKQVNLVLPGEVCLCRRFSTAYMTDEQLKFNLPYEFRDFISGGKDEYFYDYALVRRIDGEDGEPRELDLMAAAVKKSVVGELDDMFKRAGFRLTVVVPEEMAYINLLRRSAEMTDHGHCILDLGHREIKLYMFSGDSFENIRAMDFGCGAITQAVADEFNVDEHVAQTYLESDYNGCTRLERCVDIYNAIAVEVTKAVNFYRFNSGGGELSHVHLGGGAVRNKALVETLEDALNLPVEDMREFLTVRDAEADREASVAAAAAGAGMQ